MSTGESREPVEQVSGLIRVFTPAQAAKALRGIGLEDMTECALRTRAYRKQIPFHLNGHRIIFTLEDLREIAEGTSCRPEDPSQAQRRTAPPPPRSAPRRKVSKASDDPTVWRARRPRDAS